MSISNSRDDSSKDASSVKGYGNLSRSVYLPVFFSSSDDDDDSVISTPDISLNKVSKTNLSDLKHECENISFKEINDSIKATNYELVFDDVHGKFRNTTDSDVNGISSKYQSRDDFEPKASITKSVISSLATLSVTDDPVVSKASTTPLKKFQPLTWDSDDSSLEEFPITYKFETKTKQTKKSFLQSLSTDVLDEEADDDALKYRQNFKIKKFELTNKLFCLFNEKIFCNKLPIDMSIEWNNRLIQSAGYTKNCMTQSIRKSSISLSTKLLDSASRLRDTLLHEMCHAAVWIVSGARESHGTLWKNWAIRCKMAFPEIEVPTRCHTYEINYKYTYKCLKCGNNFGRHSKSINVQKHFCRCGGKLQLMN